MFICKSRTSDLFYLTISSNQCLNNNTTKLTILWGNLIMKKKLMLIVVAIMAFFMIAGVSDASAKAKVYKSHVYAAKQLKHHYFKHTYTKYSKKGLIYTTRSLKHWNHKGANYKQTAWTTNQSVTVKKSNGHKAVYYYIKNKKNGIKGWIWRGYLASKPVKTTKTTSYEGYNPDGFDGPSAADDPSGKSSGKWKSDARVTAYSKKSDAAYNKAQKEFNDSYAAYLAKFKLINNN